jgi:DNA-binding NarL/FixJ family response regulator
MNNDKIKIILVDDHEIVRDGINALLMLAKDIEVIGEASNGNELFSLLKFLKPDIILLDIMMPGKSGIKIAEDLSISYPDIKVIILSSNIDEESIFSSIDAGVSGYLSKNVKKLELIEAIRQVNAGKEYYSDIIPIVIIKKYKNFIKDNTKQKQETIVALSDREKEIVKWIAEGLSYKEIGEKLFISSRTVESHKNNILEKLELKTTVDLIKYAIKNSFIEL